MTGGLALRPSTAVLPGHRDAGRSWSSRFLLTVLAVIGFGVLLAALSPAARADDLGRGKSAGAPGRVTQAAEKRLDLLPVDWAPGPAHGAPPAAGPDGSPPSREAGIDMGIDGPGGGVHVGAGGDDGGRDGDDDVDSGGVGVGVGVDGHDSDGDDSDSGDSGGGAEPDEVPAGPVVVDPAPLPPRPLTPAGNTGTIPQSLAGDAGTTDLGAIVDGGAARPPAAADPPADAEAAGTGVSARTTVAESTAAPAPLVLDAHVETEPAPRPVKRAVARICGGDGVTDGPDARADNAPAPEGTSGADAIGASVPPGPPVDTPRPVAPSAPGPPAAPAPFPAPAGPCYAAAAGSSSGGGTHDGFHNSLAVLGDAVTASLARESARAVSGTAGSVVGGTDGAGDRPD